MRKLLKFGILMTAAAGVAKLVAGQKSAWQGLTEAEVRAKLHGKLDAMVPMDKVDQIANTIVEGMRDRGVLGEEAPVPS